MRSAPNCRQNCLTRVNNSGILLSPKLAKPVLHRVAEFDFVRSRLLPDTARRMETQRGPDGLGKTTQGDSAKIQRLRDHDMETNASRPVTDDFATVV